MLSWRMRAAGLSLGLLTILFLLFVQIFASWPSYRANGSFRPKDAMGLQALVTVIYPPRGPGKKRIDCVLDACTDHKREFDAVNYG